MNEIFVKVREAVHTKWDPIGVFDHQQTYGEYDAYIGGLCHLLVNKATPDKIFEYLWIVETESIGLQGNRERTISFANWLSENLSS